MKLKDRLMNWRYGIVIIIISTIISWIISMSTDLNRLELGALANLFFPPLIGICSIVIYMISYWINKKISILIMIILSVLIIYCGLWFFFD